jgi:hypothetical protein
MLFSSSHVPSSSSGTDTSYFTSSSKYEEKSTKVNDVPPKQSGGKVKPIG